MAGVFGVARDDGDGGAGVAGVGNCLTEGEGQEEEGDELASGMHDGLVGWLGSRLITKVSRSKRLLAGRELEDE